MRQLCFPGYRCPRGGVHLMASGGAVCPRIVAVDGSDSAQLALEAARMGPLQHVVGPQLRLAVPRLPEHAGEAVVWQATPHDVARGGLRSFVMDICQFEPPGRLIVVTSFSVVLPHGSGALERDALERALRLPDEPAEA